MEPNICPTCGKAILNNVIYKCVRCFTEYCITCENSRDGRVCPKCGMGPRMIIGLDNK